MNGLLVPGGDHDDMAFDRHNGIGDSCIGHAGVGDEKLGKAVLSGLFH